MFAYLSVGTFGDTVIFSPATLSQGFFFFKILVAAGCHELLQQSFVEFARCSDAAADVDAEGLDGANRVGDVFGV